MRIIFPLILASLFLFSSCMGGEKKEMIQMTPSESPKYAQDLSKASSKIKNTKEFEACMTPSVNMCLNTIGNQLAREKKSAAFCDEITSMEGKDACKYGVVSLEAIEKKDSNLCNTLSDPYKKECRISIMRIQAVESGDATKCEAINSEISLSGTTDLDKNRVDQCKFDMIMKKTPNDPKMCGILKENTIKNMCESMMKIQANIPATRVAPTNSPNN